MLEKKTMWAVTEQLRIEKVEAVTEDGRVITVRREDKETYRPVAGFGSTGDLKFLDSEDEAVKWAREFRDSSHSSAEAACEFIRYMDTHSVTRRALGINPEDYLGYHADSRRDAWQKDYIGECLYVRKLETFIHSRRLDIGGAMIACDSVEGIDWYSVSDAGIGVPDEWRGKVSVRNVGTIATASEADVRLLWAVFGQPASAIGTDDSISYNKEEEDGE